MRTWLLVVAICACLGVVCGATIANWCRDAHASRRAPDKRGIASCLIEGREQQTLSFVEGWEQPEGWYCALALEPRAWDPSNEAWSDALSIELGGACGWSGPAGDCCPACLVAEGGCPSEREACP